MKRATTLGRNCPLETIDRRLHDCRNYWIEAKENYNNPDEFRRSMNSCITTARSVTFLLQKFKKQIPDFDKWYEKWQILMSQDKTMRWLVEARNHIEKRGDIKTYSKAKATVYLSGGKIYLERIVNPFNSANEIAEGIRSQVLEIIQKDESSVLAIERCWINSQLQDVELLDAISYCYGFLSRIVKDSHKQCGLVNTCPICDGNISEEKIEHLQGRTPCMIATEGDRTVWIKMSTGEIVVPCTKRYEVDQNNVPSIIAHYNLNEFESIEDTNGLIGEVSHLFKLAKTMLSVDGYLVPTAILGGPNPAIIHFQIDEHIDKPIFIERLRQQIEISGAQSLILINEMWVRVPEEEHFGQEYDCKPREAMQVLGLNRTGECAIYRCEYRRKNKTILFKEPVIATELDTALLHMIEPIAKL